MADDGRDGVLLDVSVSVQFGALLTEQDTGFIDRSSRSATVHTGDGGALFEDCGRVIAGGALDDSDR